MCILLLTFCLLVAHLKDLCKMRLTRYLACLDHDTGQINKCNLIRSSVSNNKRLNKHSYTILKCCEYEKSSPISNNKDIHIYNLKVC